MTDHEQDDRYEDFAAETPAEEAVESPPLTRDERLAARFGEGILSQSHSFGEPVMVVRGESLTEIMTTLRDEEGFALLTALTAHDCSGGADPRFYVIYELINVEEVSRLRVKVGLPESSPAVPSVVSIWPGANFMEREVYDLFGIAFEGHPNLSRILMPEEWEGHPLRKDYPLVYEPVQFTHNFEAIEATKPYARR